MILNRNKDTLEDRLKIILSKKKQKRGRKHGDTQRFLYFLLFGGGCFVGVLLKNPIISLLAGLACPLLLYSVIVKQKYRVSKKQIISLLKQIDAGDHCTEESLSNIPKGIDLGKVSNLELNMDQVRRATVKKWVDILTSIEKHEKKVRYVPYLLLIEITAITVAIEAVYFYQYAELAEIFKIENYIFWSIAVVFLFFEFLTLSIYRIFERW